MVQKMPEQIHRVKMRDVPTMLRKKLVVEKRFICNKFSQGSWRSQFAILRELLRLERIRKYGKKSEELNNGQLELLEEEPSVNEFEIEKEARLPAIQKSVAKRRKHQERNPFPAHLARKEEIIVIESKERRCPCCGEERHVIVRWLRMAYYASLKAKALSKFMLI